MAQIFTEHQRTDDATLHINIQVPVELKKTTVTEDITNTGL